MTSIDPSKYQFIIQNIENLTKSPHEDSSVSVNNESWIAFISNRTGTYEIFYMDTADRITHQLTPIKGQYSGPNTDPGWKNDDVIVFSNKGNILEVNINTLQVSGPIVPEWNGTMYDPRYSPDGTKILFSAWVARKKNGYMKDLSTGKISQVLPGIYAAYKDDNPGWFYSNIRITGHLFYPLKKGRIYVKNSDSDFNIITPSTKDFRYVTPVKMFSALYLVFSDWGGGELSASLWICSDDGSYLRPLQVNGDEAVFIMLNLPIPKNKEDLKDISKIYNSRFSD